MKPEHALLRPSYQPRRKSHGLANADGWGVGLLMADRAEPVRGRSSRPLWSDTSFASVAPVLVAGCSPTTSGSPAASFRKYDDAEAVCDSALLAAHVFAQGPDHLGRTVIEVAAADPSARLRLLEVASAEVTVTALED